MNHEKLRHLRSRLREDLAKEKFRSLEEHILSLKKEIEEKDKEIAELKLVAWRGPTA